MSETRTEHPSTDERALNLLPEAVGGAVFSHVAFNYLAHESLPDPNVAVDVRKVCRTVQVHTGLAKADILGYLPGIRQLLAEYKEAINTDT